MQEISMECKPRKGFFLSPKDTFPDVLKKLDLLLADMGMELVIYLFKEMQHIDIIGRETLDRNVDVASLESEAKAGHLWEEPHPLTALLSCPKGGTNGAC